MNIPRLILAIVVGFVVIFGTDFLIHGVWMAPDYQATQQLWRPEAEMNSYRGWMFFAQLLLVFAFVMLWTRWASTARITCAIGYGFLMGIFSGTWAIIMYVVLPMPCANCLQMVLRRHRAMHPARSRHLLRLQTGASRSTTQLSVWQVRVLQAGGFPKEGVPLPQLTRQRGSPIVRGRKPISLTGM